MANYTLVGNTSIVQVLSPQVTAEVESVTIETNPSGIIAATLVSRDAFEAGQAEPALSDFAGAIEAIMAQGKAVAAYGNSALGASRLQQYSVTFEVGYNPPGAPTGTVTADVDVPVGLLSQADGEIGRVLFAQAVALVNSTYDNLVAMSGGTPAAAPSGSSSGTTSAPAAATA